MRASTSSRRTAALPSSNGNASASSDGNASTSADNSAHSSTARATPWENVKGMVPSRCGMMLYDVAASLASKVHVGVAHAFEAPYALKQMLRGI